MKLNDWTIFLDSKKRVDLKKGNVKVGLCGKKNMYENEWWNVIISLTFAYYYYQKANNEGPFTLGIKYLRGWIYKHMLNNMM